MSGEVAAPGSRRRALVAVGVAVGVAVAITLVLSGRTRLPPELTPTLEHRAALGGRDAQACLSCHARGGAPRRPASHTGREDCWNCHELKGASAPGE